MTKEVKFNLKSVRESKRLTQVDLAEKTGIHQQTISRYERGIVMPQIDSAKSIADALGVTVDELIIIKDAKERIAEKLNKIINDKE